MTSSTNSQGHGVVFRTDLIAAISVACKAALIATAVCLYVALVGPDYDAIIVLVCATLSSVAVSPFRPSPAQHCFMP
jgi:hypothetical protein